MPSRRPQRRRIERDLAREAAASRMAAELQQKIDQGGLAEAVRPRADLCPRPEGKVDERGFRAFEEIKAAQPAGQADGARAPQGNGAESNSSFMALDEERAIAAIPSSCRMTRGGERQQRLQCDACLAQRATLSEDGKQRLGAHRGTVSRRGRAPGRREATH